MESPQTAKRANLILLAGIFFNLSIGVLYAWSVIKAKLTSPASTGGWEWTSIQAGLPYTIIILFFAIGLLAGGRIQDKIGPRVVATVGGVLTGVGLILAGVIGNSVAGVALCYGIICGVGIGFGYGSVTPATLKWFHPSKKGLVSGLIVGGFSMAAVYLAPLTSMLLNSLGIQKTLIYLGAAVIFISTPLAQLIKNPPVGYIPPAPLKANQAATQNGAVVDFVWQEMIKTKRFYLLFIMFLLPSSVGLMIIGNITKIASVQIGVTDTAFLALLVSFLAVTNTCGRVLGGLMSDKIGCVNALLAVFVIQALNMVGFVFYKSLAALIIGIIALGFCYGTLISVFPSMTAGHYGLKNYGANYGVLFLAWGLAGVVAPVIADYIYDVSGAFQQAYIIAAFIMTMMIFVNVIYKTRF